MDRGIVELQVRPGLIPLDLPRNLTEPIERMAVKCPPSPAERTDWQFVTAWGFRFAGGSELGTVSCADFQERTGGTF